MSREEKEKEESPEKTVFSAFHSDIEKTGTKQCLNHNWRKVNERELACTLCPTQIIVDINDERL